MSTHTESHLQMCIVCLHLDARILLLNQSQVSQLEILQERGHRCVRESKIPNLQMSTRVNLLKKMGLFQQENL
jgi:hypothetical protein